MLMLPGQPAQAPEALLEVGPLPPAPVVAPVVPSAICSPHNFELMALPAAKEGFDPFAKLVREDVDTQEEPAPPPPPPSCVKTMQSLAAPLPPP
jgi:hypothetical protein